MDSQAMRNLEAAMRSFRARGEALRARGIACAYCEDKGKLAGADPDGRAMACPHCEAGARLRQERFEEQARASLARSGALDFEYQADSHPNKDLVAKLTAWELPDPARADTCATKPFLLLHGYFGTGKSQLAAWLLRNAIWRTGKRGRFISAARMIDDLRPSEMQSRERFDWAMRDPLVVLDDVGITPLGAGFVEERLFLVVDARYTSRLWTVITTNKDPRDSAPPAQSLERAVGTRIADRILERALVVNAGGPQQNLRRRGGIP